MHACAQTAAVVVVFAGGVHTASRYAALDATLPVVQPRTVLLTGADFPGADGVPDPLPASLPSVGGPVPVCLDDADCTLESCLFLARRLRGEWSHVDRVVAVTSNYHVPRVRWLLGAMLPARCRIEMRAVPDIRPADLRHNSQARRLIVGEVVSWIYCGPLGLALRPLPWAACAAVALIRLLRRRWARTGFRRGIR